VPDDAVADALTRRGLPQLAAGFGGLTAPNQDSRSLEQRIIAQVLDETRVMIRPLFGDARTFSASGRRASRYQTSRRCCAAR